MTSLIYVFHLTRVIDFVMDVQQREEEDAKAVAR